MLFLCKTLSQIQNAQAFTYCLLIRLWPHFLNSLCIILESIKWINGSCQLNGFLKCTFTLVLYLDGQTSCKACMYVWWWSGKTLQMSLWMNSGKYLKENIFKNSKSWNKLGVFDFDNSALRNHIYGPLWNYWNGETNSSVCVKHGYIWVRDQKMGVRREFKLGTFIYV